MTLRAGVNLIVLTVLVVVAAVWASAQVTQPPGPRGRDLMKLVAPTVISGSDLGFRIESNTDNVPVGKLVVRINGVWVDAQVGTSGIVVATPR
jgi:hypothetical protein